MSGLRIVPDGRLTKLLLGFLLLLFVFAAPAQGRKPRKVTDLVVVQSEGTTIFVVDVESKGVFFYKLPPNFRETHISLDFFNEIQTSPKIDEPSAIAYFSGSLFICERDEDLAGVYRLDLKSLNSIPGPKTVTRIAGKPDLEKPKSIAVSDRGLIAVGDDKLDDVILFEPDPEDQQRLRYKPRKLNYEKPPVHQSTMIDEPDRVGFTGEHVVVLDTNNGTLSVVNSKPSGETDYTIEVLNKLLGEISIQIRSVKDFTVYNGIYYIADAKKVTAFAPFTSHKTSKVLERKAEDVEHAVHSRLAAADDHIFVTEDLRNSILVVPRPVPVSINFELAANQKDGSTEKMLERNLVVQRNALVNLYEHLATSKLLDTREVKLRRDYGKNVRSLLLDEMVLFERPYPESWFTIKDDRFVKRLENLVCELNRGRTDGLCGKDGTLNLSLAKDTTLVLPTSLKFEVGLTVSEVALGQRTVMDHLNSRVLESQLKSGGITAEYLLRLNRGRINSVESALARLNFHSATTPSTKLKPGTLLEIVDGRENIIGDLSKCVTDFDAGMKSTSFDLPSSLTSKKVDGILPFRDQKPNNVVSLKEMGIDSVKLDFKNVSIYSVGKSGFEAARVAAATGEGCSLPVGSGREIYVIDSAIRTENTSVKLSGRGNEKALTQEQLDSSGLFATISRESPSTLVSPSPLFLGYTLLKVDLNEKASTWKSFDASSSTGTHGGNFIFSETNTTLVLPATRWRLSLFLNAKDLDETPGLAELRSTAGVSIYSEEKFATASTAQKTHLDSDDDPVTKNRTDLLKLLSHFEIDEKRLGQVYVGVAEIQKSVHVDHPDFADVWYRPSDPTNPSEPWIPVSQTVGDGVAAPSAVRAFETENDHGDHVGGLIASRGSILPGIAKGVKLFHVDTSNSSPASLEKQIDIGVSSGLVSIFNFSFTLGDEVTAEQIPRIKGFDNLKNNIGDAWKNTLFIMAAGNDGVSLDKKTLFPIHWAEKLGNVIGVGAVDFNGRRLLVTPCPPNQATCRGSNFGKSYIHLLAPGPKMFSPVVNGYAAADGTSQATALVSASAALLQAQGIDNIRQIKARLIYSATWESQLSGEVWGGRLDIRRAVIAPRKNLLVFRQAPEELYAFDFANEKNNPLTLRVTNVNSGESGKCKSYPRLSQPFRCDEKIPFQDVLRIQRINEKYRVIYLDVMDGRTYLKIIENVELGAITIPCRELLKWNEANKTFEATPCIDLQVRELLDDYTARIPTTTEIEF